MAHPDLFQIIEREQANEGIASIINSILLFRSNEAERNAIEIEIHKFKKIDFVRLKLEPVNIFIGTNNSGKSSFIQGIQFAISSCQTLELKKVNWVKKSDSRTLALDSSDFLYTPTRQVEHLYHGQKLTGAKTKSSKKSIYFKFSSKKSISVISISRGKNGGFTTSHRGRILGEILNNVADPFCVYVPGIAGIPIEEKFEVPISIKKSATRGDSNNYLRNILWTISKEEKKWENFHNSINKIYPNTRVNTWFDENISEFIEVSVKTDGLDLPIDSVGTGVLQAIQIFAYLEYFSPQLLMLDEPDSHIHPTKQQLLASELYKRAKSTNNLKIVFSTHSRYILDALEDKAQVIHFQNGKAYSGIKGSKILLDIGAADADYLFSKKDLQYILVTEDKVDNIDEKKEFLKKFVIANGLSEEQFVLHSYEGCKKVHFAKLLEGFVRKHIPHVKVILHFDRDQRVDDDRELQSLIADCARENILLFITEYSEIENYFCQPKHLMDVYGFSREDSEKIYSENLKALRQTTEDKIANFLLRERAELCRDKSNLLDIKKVNTLKDEYYRKYYEFLTPGKELLGRIKNELQSSFKKRPQDIMTITKGLESPFFKKLIETE